jgi:hypothetical protein
MTGPGSARLQLLRRLDVASVALILSAVSPAAVSGALIPWLSPTGEWIDV